MVQPADTPEEFVRPKRAAVAPIVPSVIRLGEWGGLEKSGNAVREGVTQVGSQRVRCRHSRRPADAGRAAVADLCARWSNGCPEF